jgi:hypothetical protein
MFVLRILREEGQGRLFVGLDGRGTRFELVGYVVTRVMWQMENASRHDVCF